MKSLHETRLITTTFWNASKIILKFYERFDSFKCIVHPEEAQRRSERSKNALFVPQKRNFRSELIYSSVHRKDDVKYSLSRPGNAKGMSHMQLWYMYVNILHFRNSIIKCPI
jgi:hypothetical protein